MRSALVQEYSRALSSTTQLRKSFTHKRALYNFIASKTQKGEYIIGSEVERKSQEYSFRSN